MRAAGGIERLVGEGERGGIDGGGAEGRACGPERRLPDAAPIGGRNQHLRRKPLRARR